MTSQKDEFVKLWDVIKFVERKHPLAKNELFVAIRGRDMGNFKSDFLHTKPSNFALNPN